MSESTNRPDRKNAYEALIKPGDAVETPDGEIWIVEGAELDQLTLVSAYKDSDGVIYAERYETVHTSLPREHVTKIADARRVRR